MERRPNILYIMADQWHAGCLGSAGSQVRTPNLDGLAAEGVTFNRAYCNVPVCGPSRSTFITGQYPRTHGMMSNEIYYLEPEHDRTLPMTFRRYGYQTAMIGKSHSVKKWDEEGYEHIRYSDLTDGDWRDPMHNHYFRYLYEHGLACEYDLNDVPDKRAFVSKIPEKHSLEVWTGDRAVEFLQHRDKRRPFMLHLSFQRPHNPLAVPFDRGLQYDPEQIELPENAKDLFERRFDGKPAYMKQLLERQGGSPYHPESKADLKRQLAHYYSLMTFIDEQIGRVLEHLKQTGEYEHTVIVFVSDHGDFSGEHGLMLKGATIYEALHRIPFILKYPGVPSGTTCEELVESVDLFPTLCELADVPAPSSVEGQAVVPVAEGRSPGKAHVICEKANGQFTIRTRGHRLIYNGAGEEGELYDLTSDPHELNNLYEAAGHAGTRLLLMEVLFDHIRNYRTLDSEEPGSAYRNCMTRLIHKHQVNWGELERLYRH